MLGKTNSLFLLAYFSCPEFLSRKLCSSPAIGSLVQSAGMAITSSFSYNPWKDERKKRAEHTRTEWGWRPHDDNENHLLAFHSFLCESAEFLAPRLCLWKGAAPPRPSRDSCLHVQSRVSPFVPRPQVLLGHSHQAWLWSSPSILGPLPIQCGCAWPWWPLSSAWARYGPLCVQRALFLTCSIHPSVSRIAASTFFLIIFTFLSLHRPDFHIPKINIETFLRIKTKNQ